jgi:hypothetical protein
MAKKEEKFIQEAIKKPGALTAQAKKAGFDTATEFARHVLQNPEKYDDTTIRRARLAITLGKLARRKK